MVTEPPIAGGSSQMTSADIAPAGLQAGAANSGNQPNYLLGATATNRDACAGKLLLATSPPAGPRGGDHNPLLGCRPDRSGSAGLHIADPTR